MAIPKNLQLCSLLPKGVQGDLKEPKRICTDRNWGVSPSPRVSWPWTICVCKSHSSCLHRKARVKVDRELLGRSPCEEAKAQLLGKGRRVRLSSATQVGIGLRQKMWATGQMLTRAQVRWKYSIAHWVTVNALATSEKAFSAKEREVGNFCLFHWNERSGSLENKCGVRKVKTLMEH